jgi:Cu+-exporting ATPase
MGITPMLLTGDSAQVARHIADEVGIAPDDVIAGVLPTEKADAVKHLQSQGRTVAMVGDGVNDSVALAVADIGMAMGSGADAAIDAGDLTLMRTDVHTVPTALRLSARTLRTIRMNLFWAFAYNTAAIPLAALGLLNPMISGAAMACSSLLVVTNSLRLRGFGNLPSQVVIQDASQASSLGSC